MIYFLDFDRTLFDTDAYNASLADERACTSFSDEIKTVLASKRDETQTGGVDRIAVWQKVSDAIRSGALTFAPGKLEHFLYPDALELLRALGNEAVIVTYGDLDRQKIKVESALANVVRVTVLYTEHKTKAEYLSEWPGYYGQEAVFVDDRVAELEGLSVAYPALKLYEMRRDGGAGDGRFKVIHSLNDLP